ncbi:rCG63227 [Rattus norvegicus]|uniref:RCG63227 n=1 Tax=Rattus norvegicus TaxID=10116 RepID=A6IYZ6_RAT|nr:rCG63227 [Rattus norvegicus]
MILKEADFNKRKLVHGVQALWIWSLERSFQLNSAQKSDSNARFAVTALKNRTVKLVYRWRKA